MSFTERDPWLLCTWLETLRGYLSSPCSIPLDIACDIRVISFHFHSSTMLHYSCPVNIKKIMFSETVNFPVHLGKKIIFPRTCNTSYVSCVLSGFSDHTICLKHFADFILNAAKYSNWICWHVQILRHYFYDNFNSCALLVLKKPPSICTPLITVPVTTSCR